MEGGEEGVAQAVGGEGGLKRGVGWGKRPCSSPGVIVGGDSPTLLPGFISYSLSNKVTMWELSSLLFLSPPTCTRIWTNMR